MSQVKYGAGEYQLTRALGKGGFGTVYEGVNERLGRKVALKFISKEIYSSLLSDEAAMARACAHENVVRLLETDEDEENIILIYELMKTTLESVKTRFTFSKVKAMMRQLLEAVQACHERNVCHLDIKPANILLGFDGKIKLADFGLACRTNDPLPLEAFTLNYRPPELILEPDWYDGRKADMWAVGLVFAYLLLKNNHMFSSKQAFNLLENMCSIFGKPNESSWPNGDEILLDVEAPEPSQAPGLWSFLRSKGCRPEKRAYNLLKRMLIMDPGQRITAAEALASDYFT